MTWTPSQDLTGWKGSKFSAGVKVTGMPYSQTPNQKNKSGFLASMSASDFYSVYIDGENRSMPRYGNDCSGFVSFSWGISRTTTQGFLKGILDGTYSAVGNTGYRIRKDSDNKYRIYSYDDVTMKEGFVQMSKGDALVQYGHTFLVAANSAGYEVVYVYEQTPQKARYTSYTYDTLTDGYYVPFTK